MSPQTYLKSFCLLTTFILIIGGFLNYLVNPFDMYSTPRGIPNFDKIFKRDFARMVKARDIVRFKPKTLILGSSRSGIGLDPQELSGFPDPVYNLALPGASIYEIRSYLEHALANQKLDTVLLGLDFFSFNKHRKPSAGFEEQRLKKKTTPLLDHLNSLISYEVLKASFKTVIFFIHPKKQKPTLIASNGLILKGSNENQTKERFLNGIHDFAKDPEIYGHFDLSDEELNEHEKIVLLCKQNNIKLYVFISPAHATEVEIIRHLGYGSLFQTWKKRLAQQTAIWDFSGYNSVTTEPITSSMKNYLDLSHYTPPIGKLIIETIVNNKPSPIHPDFGILLTSSQDFDFYFKDEILRQTQWKTSFAEDSFFIQKALDKVTP